ncbi:MULTISPECIES: helix-turn-helix domain-containing protein [unclassified Rhizobium]|jgi:transcriptional regulator with XRE-family HTH domain|uniref:helix-turn-helix domain-containing protein n=1 Tax=unclassified Rhizobium TaxID=2613769 RepID=UPI000DDA85D3|nr:MULTISPECIES: helix-turn-helix domain-containing protein [unclassified Rhizobium]MBB3445264.1 transcriptional regulator with XRE-family HTH domain [Rhizobium sp. BK379]MBB3561338.1 transcriptional regulator with XRE-family HTH domain [Rhizobium sp. BK512]
MNVKTPNAIDTYVGMRMRRRRQLLGMSQERLAEQIGVTFQQVQKYEKGINRIGASRLQRIAEVLRTSPAFFFEQDDLEAPSLAGLDLSAPVDPVTEFLRSKEGLVLNRAFMKIEDRRIRETIISLVKAMAQSENSDISLNAPRIDEPDTRRE